MCYARGSRTVDGDLAAAVDAELGRAVAAVQRGDVTDGARRRGLRDALQPPAVCASLVGAQYPNCIARRVCRIEMGER